MSEPKRRWIVEELSIRISILFLPDWLKKLGWDKHGRDDTDSDKD